VVVSLSDLVMLILNQKWNYEMKPHFYFENTFCGHLFLTILSNFVM
jgi:hypothetical protein